MAPETLSEQRWGGTPHRTDRSAVSSHGHWLLSGKKLVLSPRLIDAPLRGAVCPTASPPRSSAPRLFDRAVAVPQVARSILAGFGECARGGGAASARPLRSRSP